jgi:hypothetical protein
VKSSRVSQEVAAVQNLDHWVNKDFWLLRITLSRFQLQILELI